MTSIYFFFAYQDMLQLFLSVFLTGHATAYV
nr:MAG TPA: hypothetical protein [Caudoviricetes sp.]